MGVRRLPTGRMCVCVGQLSFVCYDSYPLGFPDTTLGAPPPPTLHGRQAEEHV